MERFEPSRIIWVAIRPPIAPFSGITSKTLCGLDALSNRAAVDLITFADVDDKRKIEGKLKMVWQNKLSSIHVLKYGQKQRALQALCSRRLITTASIPRQAVARVLSNLSWPSASHLVIFDDIAFAPVALQYGINSIISPHDCMSQMFLANFKSERMGLSRMARLFQHRISLYYEKAFYHFYLMVHVISHRDRVLLERINPRARYHVVPNADLLNPGLVVDFKSEWDILVWGDLGVPACSKGFCEFVKHARIQKLFPSAKILLVGKVTEREAREILGDYMLKGVKYSPRIEDGSGRMQAARIVLVPDIGGAGIKNRVVNVISSGLCLACLLPQMEGLEAVSDRGAINAVTMSELVSRIKVALKEGRFKEIATVAKNIYREQYMLEWNRDMWWAMIQRAMAIRSCIA